MHKRRWNKLNQQRVGNWKIETRIIARLPTVLLIASAVLALVLLSPLLVVVHLLMRLVDEVSGEGAWYRRQKQAMQFERPPLPDAEFLRSLPDAPGEGALWLAVRRAVADSVGLPPEAIYPEDRLADLWRMQSLGPDIMDLVFRLERSLAVKISRPSIERFGRGIRYGQAGEFQKFAGAVVRELHGLEQ